MSPLRMSDGYGIHGDIKNTVICKLVEAADLCGFRNIQTFLRIYKILFGCTPSEKRSREKGI